MFLRFHEKWDAPQKQMKSRKESNKKITLKKLNSYRTANSKSFTQGPNGKNY